MTNNRPTLHLCDFDGTLTTGDSLLRFLWFAAGPTQWARALVLVPFRFLGLLLTGNWSNEKAKERLLGTFFKGMNQPVLQAIGSTFCREKLPELLRQPLLDTLRESKQRGDLVVIVSASLDIWLAPFCQLEGFDLLCTELLYQKSGVLPDETPRFTGYFATPNCNSQEKARRILAAYSLQDFSRVIAYGNSVGDEAMFELAQEKIRF